MRARRAALKSKLQKYYESWRKRFEAENETFGESAIRFAEERHAAPPVTHWAAQ